MDKMVAEFGLENYNWVSELYSKREMWATTHIRGIFFDGFRTTSREIVTLGKFKG